MKLKVTYISIIITVLMGIGHIQTACGQIQYVDPETGQVSRFSAPDQLSALEVLIRRSRCILVKTYFGKGVVLEPESDMPEKVASYLKPYAQKALLVSAEDGDAVDRNGYFGAAFVVAEEALNSSHSDVSVLCSDGLTRSQGKIPLGVFPRSSSLKKPQYSYWQATLELIGLGQPCSAFTDSRPYSVAFYENGSCYVAFLTRNQFKEMIKIVNRYGYASFEQRVTVPFARSNVLVGVICGSVILLLSPLAIKAVKRRSDDGGQQTKDSD